MSGPTTYTRYIMYNTVACLNPQAAKTYLSLISAKGKAACGIGIDGSSFSRRCSYRQVLIQKMYVLPLAGLDSIGQYLVIINTAFINNRVSSTISAQGGGYYAWTENVDLIDCTIYGNTVEVSGLAGSTDAIAGLGGGLYVGRGTMTIQRCNISANLASVAGSSAVQPALAGGGGLAVTYPMHGTTTRVIMTGSWLRSNMVRQRVSTLVATTTCARGGGVLVSGGAELSLVDRPVSVFINNSVQSPVCLFGGAAYVDSTSTIVIQETPRVVDYTGYVSADTLVNTLYGFPTPAPTPMPTMSSSRSAS